MKKKSLLSKTLLQFLFCTATLFTLMAPLFYLLTKCFYAEDIIKIVEAVEQGHSIPPIDLERDIIEGMMIQSVLIFLVVSLSLFITLRVITRRLWLPFEDSLQKIDQFNLSQEKLPHFVETDIREFEQLNDSLDRLMRKNQETFRIQKEFTENASHELQTPLAAIRSKLDLLMQEGLTESQMRLVSDLYVLTMRMGHLNKNLLLLAKIDNAQYHAKEEVDIGALLSDSLPLYNALPGGLSLQVNDCRSKRRTLLRANPVLLECLLKNLIVNAIRYSGKGHTVNILIEDRRLTVSNTAAEGRPLDTDLLFRRFRSGDVRQKGNGLGLAIVKAICDLHGWSVTYHFEEGKHRFVIAFA